MSVLDQAQRLTAAGRQREAIELVATASSAGDAEAMYAVANWRLFAMYGGRDLAEAHRLLGAAATSGHTPSAQLRAYLTANGTGVAADPTAAQREMERLAPHDPFAAAQVMMLREMPAALPAPRILCADPQVKMIDGFASERECNWIRTLAGPRLEPSFVIDSSTGRRMPHPVRTSSGTSFGPTQEDLVVNAINRRIARATGTEHSWGEPLHILRYAPGQEYKPHVDTLPGEANQRGWTALLYLNDEYAGGETVFPETKVSARGRTGSLLIFANLAADGRPDPRTRHAGKAVTSGEKWLATRWVRQRPYHPWA
jgi:prolyl 4-hydroxylase